MSTHELTKGCTLFVTDSRSYLFGCVTEAIKFMQAKGLLAKPVAGIVLPDTWHLDGIPNCAPEFPLYWHLFVGGGFKKLRESGFAEEHKFQVIGTPEQLERAREILRITLLGPTVADFKRWQKRYPKLRRSLTEDIRLPMNWFQLKGADGTALTLDDLVSFQSFELARLEGGRTVMRTAPDTFQVSEPDGTVTQICLAAQGRPKAPFAIAPSEGVHEAMTFGARVLSYGNGFDGRTGCTAIVVWLNGVPLLVDAAPFCSEMLTASGISVQQLGGLVLTHVHDDHCSVLELLSRGGQLRLYTTAEIYESLLIKLGAQLGFRISEPDERAKLEKFFDFQEIRCGEPSYCYGAKLIAHYTAHSIPTIGVRFALAHGDEQLEILVVGDNPGHAKLDEMLAGGGISASWYERLKNLVIGDEDLVFLDAGGDPDGLHANPLDPYFAELVRRMQGRVFFGHRAAAPPEAERLPIARSGLLFKVDGRSADPCEQLILSRALAELGVQAPWSAKALWHLSDVREFPAMTEVINVGATAPNAFFVLAGCLDVLANGKVAALLEVGDFFGEVAVLTDRPRNATVQARSAVRLLVIPRSAFAEFVEEHQLRPAFEAIWAGRTVLAEVDVFEALPARELNRLSVKMRQIEFVKGATVITEGDADDAFFVLAEGSLRVTRGERDVAVLVPGSIFGEGVATGAITRRSATITAETPARVYRIEAKDLWKHPEVPTAVQLRLRTLFEQRNGHGAPPISPVF